MFTLRRKVRGLSYSNSQQLRTGYLACMSNPVPCSECIWYFSREVIKDPREIYLVTLQSHQGHWDLILRSKQHLKRTMQHLPIKYCFLCINGYCDIYRENKIVVFAPITQNKDVTVFFYFTEQ